MTSNADHVQKEQAALVHIARRLAARFPTLSTEEIRSAIRGCHDRFERSRVRDFVPVLVERSAREHLAAISLRSPVRVDGGAPSTDQ